ncbi:MAG: PucR family transcriptional regulator [Lachnospiraceae bacterium]|nr:PucR family transcriptional regulator [Lachnospiraceae bacterium]
MTITLQKLCENAKQLYGMRNVAGSQGMKNIVQWVHTLEDERVSAFLHGGELVFTTGIGQQGTEWLVSFARSLKAREASGLVINLGPYIEKLPEELCEYCNEVGFPLFIIPWETRLVDVTRDFCNRIIQNEKVEADVASTLKNLIFYPQEAERYLPVLERHDFDLNQNCCVLCVDIRPEKELGEQDREFLNLQIDRMFQRMPGSYGSFVTEQVRVFVLFGYSEEQRRELAGQFKALARGMAEGSRIYVSAGTGKERIEHISRNYQKAMSLLKICERKERDYLSYDELDVQRILLSVDEEKLLYEYVEETLEKLRKYDAENHTEYLQLLKYYLENDGSIQAVAEKLYVHRNTINYQLKRIKKILGMEFNTLAERFRLLFAFKIMEIL